MLRHHSVEDALKSAMRSLTQKDYDTALLAIAFAFSHVARERDDIRASARTQERIEALKTEWISPEGREQSP